MTTRPATAVTSTELREHPQRNTPEGTDDPGRPPTTSPRTCDGSPSPPPRCAS